MKIKSRKITAKWLREHPAVTPQIEQRVWVNFLNVRPAKEGRGYEVTATVKECEFYRVRENYMGSGQLRWVVGPIGKRLTDLPNAPYGTAYLPERVFLSPEYAKMDLRRQAHALADRILESVQVL